MKALAKIAIGALAIGGAALMPIASAEAGVSVGIGIGAYPTYPAYPAYPSYPASYGDPCYYSPYGYPPGYCDYPVYYGPVFIGGVWYNEPMHYRYWNGERQFWYNGGWQGGYIRY